VRISVPQAFLHAAAEVLAAASACKLLCVPVYDTADLCTSEQLNARDFFVRVGKGPRERLLPGAFAVAAGGRRRANRWAHSRC
jgi:crotonobetainyl-CoA:carnitine CoA-transferase CaiB-like acyl-CoA transferase